MQYALKRMNDKKWLDKDYGVMNAPKVAAILNGFDGIYEAKKEVKATRGATNNTKLAIKNFELGLNPVTTTANLSCQNKAAPRVELLPH